MDWIRVHTTYPDVIRRRTLELSECCSHDHPEPKHARVWRLEEGVFALAFEEALLPIQFTNLIGHLLDAPEVTDATGWMNTAQAQRFRFQALAGARTDDATMALLGVTQTGISYEVHLPDGSLTRVASGSTTFEEPRFPPPGEAIERWQVTFDRVLGPTETLLPPDQRDGARDGNRR